MKKILHISDIHSSVRANQGNSQADLKKVVGGLILDLISVPKPDTIFITGDIANSGDPSEYEQFFIDFLQPLVSSLGIALDRIVLVPGNHDSNRRTWRQANSLVRDQLCLNYSSEKVDKQLSEYIEDKYPPFLNFEKFRTDLVGKGGLAPIINNYLYCSYDIDGVGVAGINTAWLAYEKDLGKLMIGKKQLTDLLRSIRGNKQKVVLMHHPLEWLHQEDRDKISEQLYQSHISCIFYGHMHEFSLSKESRFDEDSVLRLQAGKLDLHEDGSVTGYTLIELNEENIFEDGVIYFRRWDNKRESFVPWTERASDGKHSFSIRDALPFNSSLFFDICRKKMRAMETDLLCNVGLPEEQHRKLTEVFVCPSLTWEMPPATEMDEAVKSNSSDAQSEQISLHTLMSSNDSLLLLGGENSGKSTLAKRMAINYLARQADGDISQCVFYFDAKDGFISKLSRLKKNLLGFYFDDVEDSSCEEKIKRKLTSGNAIILIDSCESLDNNSLKVLFDFIETYPAPRYILCSQLAARSDLIDRLNRLSEKKFKSIKVAGLKRAHVRQLFEKWSPSSKGKNFHTVSAAIKSITGAGMPSNPFVYTMLLSIKERKATTFRSYMHEADLVENFMEIILEKHVLTAKNDPQYKDLILFLGYVASLMQKSGDLALSDTQMASAVADFNHKISQNFSYNGYVNPLVQCGILRNGNGRYVFSQICFFNYSLAHWFVKLNTPYVELEKEIDFLQHDKVFEYISAIKKNDCELLSYLEGKIELAWMDLSSLGGITDLDSLEVEVSKCVSHDLIDMLSNNQIDEELNNHSRSQEEADSELDEVSPLQDRPSSTGKKRIGNALPRLYFNELLSLYGRVFRAAEHLMDVDVSAKHFSKIFDFYMKLASLHVRDFDKKIRPAIVSKISRVLDYHHLDLMNQKLAIDQINAFLNFVISAIPNWSVAMMNSDFFNQRQLDRMLRFREGCSSNMEKLLITYSLCELEGIDISKEITSQKYEKPHESSSLLFKVVEIANFNFSIDPAGKRAIEDFAKKVFKDRKNRSLLKNHIAISTKILA